VRTPKWLSTAGNQFNSWGSPQVPYSGPGLCRTRGFKCLLDEKTGDRRKMFINREKRVS
jgi:hypothetical protein